MFNDTECTEVNPTPPTFARRKTLVRLEGVLGPEDAAKPTFIAPSLAAETREVLPTREAAHHLNRAEQTLRTWAMRDGSGPLRPIRINGRLAWRVSDIKRVLGVTP
jgi:hypothetical protein